MFAGRPIIGLAGGMGSGKTHVAAMLREMGCFVIDSDAHVRESYRTPAVLDQLRRWWGPDALMEDGSVNRAAIARRIFASAEERQRLEGLIHPLVRQYRDREMARAALDGKVLAFVWDTPLLFEAGLNQDCDAIWFIEADPALRLKRLSESRGWEEAELVRREKFQWPLDKKRNLSDHVLKNTAGAEDLRGQVREALSQLLAKQLNQASGSGRVQ